MHVGVENENTIHTSRTSPEVSGSITFIDTEISEDSKRILDFGGIREDGGSVHTSNPDEFLDFVRDSDFLCGHNLLRHDLPYMKQQFGGEERGRVLEAATCIDTLYLSPLLFPQRPYHALLKDDKLQTDELNNPLNDAKKARDLFHDEAAVFLQLPRQLKGIFYALLCHQPTHSGFFSFLSFQTEIPDVEGTIRSFFEDRICQNAPLHQMVENHPVELAYCLALIQVDDSTSVTPAWILHQYPHVDRLIRKLRGVPCLEGCAYCNDQLDAVHGLKRFFGFDAYRTFDGVPLQQQASEAAVRGQSLLAIFPTGGGKSITFQVPALMAGQTFRALTVVISPLQSLMKDQVDNLEREDITDAVTINGLLDPIERANALHRVESGEAHILYISPESLRSRTIERLLLNRKIARFVIDEAHCFSAWGQDFRVDYLYIGDFIKSICQKKKLDEMIPVSCFTATAKQNVIEDIRSYFKEKLDLDLVLFSAGGKRKNLHYNVMERTDEAKLEALRDLLASKPCPTIVYVSRTKKAVELAARLTADGYPAKPYHGKMEKQEKSENQDAFIRGDIRTMVATSAFGMGVDKKDVGMVVHYEISSSLESYVQEAGRAGRDQNITADCYVLFNDEDLNKHFILLNQTRISQQEIQQIWAAIKQATRTRTRMSNSALEIAREAGWDDQVRDIETRVKTAIAALETAGYVKRGQNMPRIFADSILAKNVIEASEKIRRSDRFNDKEKEQAVRIIQKLISTRSRKAAQVETPECRVDYIADDLGMTKNDVIHIVQLLRDEHLLADAKDLVAYLDETGTANRSKNTLSAFRELEAFLLDAIPEEPTIVHLKELNERAEVSGLKRCNPDRLRTLLNYWEVGEFIHREINRVSTHLMRVTFRKGKDLLKDAVDSRHDLAAFILDYLDDTNTGNNKTLEFSVMELKEAYNQEIRLGKQEVTFTEVEGALLFLSRIGALKLDGGFLVTYNGLSIERLEMDNKIRYKVEDYKNLRQYYEQKTQMIHIVGEYARKMMENYEAALQFVDDYFQLAYSSFIKKYFPNTRNEEIQRNMSPQKFRKIFGELSPAQLGIIRDKESPYIVVAAGPGSGKTRTLVHKLASLLLMEDVKHEQLLMVTFSRAAATEFKKRLQELIGNAAHFVEIKTFHSYCFDLLGRVGNLEKSQDVVSEAVARIHSGDVEPSRITKTVLVIDEAQDMDKHEAALVSALIERNDDMRVIAVGDDDQNIYAFRGSDSKHMQEILQRENAHLHELVDNYRSRRNLVAFTNVLAARIQSRMKKTPIMPVHKELGQIRVIRYQYGGLIVPLVDKMIQEGIRGSTCMLTWRNDEALQLTSLLQWKGIDAKLIQSTEKYELFNLHEIRFFLEAIGMEEKAAIISEDKWEEAKKRLKGRFGKSRHLPMCLQMIRDFEGIHNKYKYRSDLLTFIHESREEDFLNGSQGAIHVSTMHKSKGREFDHVVLMLDGFSIENDEAKRLLYVAMTRARQSLTVHVHGDWLGNRQDPEYRYVEGLEMSHDTQRYEPAGRIMLQLSYKDVFLSFFDSTQRMVGRLTGGEALMLNETGCLTEDGKQVLQFSKHFLQTMKHWEGKGYKPVSASVNHVLYWKSKERPLEIQVLFPEVVFERRME